MKRYLLLVLVFVIPFGVTKAQKSTAKSLKVLFVGYDPSKPMPTWDKGRMGPGGMSEAGFKAEYPIRMPAFKQLLSNYFSTVKTMDVRDWKTSDSEAYDVTIFDFPTTPVEAAVNEVGADGKRIYKSAKYLPDDFSKPVIFIASTADQMGRAIGLKLDWLCLCLDADAHHLKSNHAIFKGPVEKVNPTFMNKPTPEGVFHYASGANLPKELPMWRVDKSGYLDSRDARIGLVSRGNRFSESPDTEVISSGVCQKDVGAVALGRHGNFFLWGFGASPEGMTEEGKKVFVNTVAYMAQFDGRTPIARKYNDRMATTDDVRENIAGTSKKSYDDYVVSMTDFNKQNAETRKRLDTKKASGEKLSSEEEQQLQYAGRDQKIESIEAFLKRRMGKWADQFGTDAKSYQKYMYENIDYIYCDPNEFFTYTIDEDVRQIGISNHDVKLLDACIAMLKKGDRSDLALRVLKRYTAKDFTTAKDWENWLSKNRKKLFFTETDGYRFMVDTYSL